MRELLDPVRVFPIGRGLMKELLVDTGTVPAHPGRKGCETIAKLYLHQYRQAARLGA
jgi:hypothetical protein